MKRTYRLGCLAVAGALLSVPPLAGDSAAAEPTPTQDSVTGTGTISGAGQLPFDIQAVSGPSGENATGHVNIDFAIGPFRGTVTGLCANGSQAVVYGFPTVLPAGISGDGFVLYVDDRTSQLVVPDVVRIEFVTAQPMSCPPFALPFSNPVSSGDIAVVDVLAPPAAPAFTMAPDNVSTGTSPGSCSAFDVSPPQFRVTGSPAPNVTYSPQLAGPFPLGNTEVTATASNGIAPNATATFLVTVTDTEPPQVFLDFGPAVVDATSPAGFEFGYPPPTVSDNCGLGSITRIEGPASGSVVPAGDTTVTFQAVDTASLVTRASFRLHVRGVDEQFSILQGQASGVGPGKALYDTATAARAAYAQGKTKNACNALDDFKRLVAAQAGRKIDVNTAGSLHARAEQIRAVLAC